MVPLLASEQHWTCPNCPVQDVTRNGETNRMHTCAGLAGLTAPLVPAGVRAKVEAQVREDYVGRELVTLDDNGRPVMSVLTTRDDGTDVAVFAPTALLRIE